jgi:ATP adenylyltransferase
MRAAMRPATTYTEPMDRLWTPWRYNYITGAAEQSTDQASEEERRRRRGVPKELAAWPGPGAGCVFCNIIRSADWAIAEGMPVEQAERAGLIVARFEACFVCLNAFPSCSGHVLIVPYEHTDSLAKLPAAAAEEMFRTAQTIEMALRRVYRPDGINLGMNLGEAAGAGVAEHIHLHELPRWFGDTNFMTVAAETRVLPETLEVTWERLRGAIALHG